MIPANLDFQGVGFSWIMTNEEGKWLVKVMHNLDLTAITPIK